MTDEPPSSYAVELRPYSDKYSHTTPGQYLEIPIPDEIEKLGLEYGDTVYMDFMSADDASYIRIKFSDTGTRHDLKLKYRDDRDPRHAITFPTEYTVTRDDSPFQGIGRDETVTVEFNYGLEPEIRVYTEDGYRKRTAELVSNDLTPTLKAPVLAPVLSRFTDRYVDLAADTPFEGQKFRILPFASQSNWFIREANDEYLDSENMEIRADPELLDSVLEKKGRPSQRVEKIKIRWVPHLYKGKKNGPENTAPDRVPPALSDFTKIKQEGYSQNPRLIYKDYFTKEVRIILPEIGAYEIKTTTQIGRGRSWLFYFSQSQYPALADKFTEDNWHAYYFNKPVGKSESYKLFVPSPTGKPMGSLQRGNLYKVNKDKIEVIWPFSKQQL